MKQIIVSIIMLGLGTIGISAQTIDHGNGIVSVQNGNSYKLTRNQKSDNGGTVTMTFSGNLKDGKRDGVWKLTSTYNNYGGGNGYYFTGTTTMSRTYKGGILNGNYNLTQNVKHRTGRYNRVRGVWEYGPYEDGTEQVTGCFNDGKPTGKWVINTPMLKCSFELSNGTPIGNVNVSKTAMGGGINMTFRNGYLVKWEPISNKSGGEGLLWNENEDLPNLPNQEEGDLLNELDFLGEYMSGSDLSKWIVNYPQNSSNEKLTVPYKMADRDSHYVLFGNPSSLDKQLFEMAQEGRKQKAINEKNYKAGEAIRLKIEEISEPLLKKWEKENPTYHLNIYYWRLQAYKEAVSKEELMALEGTGRGQISNEIYRLFENEEKLTQEYNERLKEATEILIGYGYSEDEIFPYIHTNIDKISPTHEIDYKAAQIYHVQNRKKEFANLADSSPITLADYEFYYKWNPFNKKNIIDESALKEWRKDVLVNGFSYSDTPITLDYSVLSKHIKRLKNTRKYIQELSNYVDYYAPSISFPIIESPVIQLLGYYYHINDKDWEKIIKEIVKKNPQFKEKK